MNSPQSSQEPTPARPEATGPLAFITSRPIAIFMLMVAMAVFGWVSFGKLSMDLMPEISYPTLTVRTNWDGAAPEDIESRISEGLQETLATLPGLVRTSSTSRAGISDVTLDFEWGTQMTQAVPTVRQSIDSVRLPRGSERPLILRYDPNLDPILRIGVSTPERRESIGTSNDRLINLRWIAEQRIKRELENLEGVAAVQIHGGLEEEIRVRVDPRKLAALHIGLAEVDRRLAQENLNASGGSLLEGSTEYLVRTRNEFETIEEIADLGIATRNGSTVRISDIGEVVRGHKKREVITRIAGAESVEIGIFREAGANIIDVAASVKNTLFGTDKQRQKLAEIEAEGREPGPMDRDATNFLGYRIQDEADLELLADQSTFIEGAVNDVKSAAVLGALFAVLVIWVFLRKLSTTFVIGTAIPISVIVTFAPMFMLDVSLNIMSLGGLALGVGMLVDNAIVVLESITRCREEGDDIRAAAIRGTREVVGAVTASTLTTVAVFAPIVFVTGIAGQIFGDQAITVVTSLFVSLIVALLFIPMLSSRRWLMDASTLGSELRAAAPGKPLQGLSFRAASFIPSCFALAGRSLLWVAALVMRVLFFAIGRIYKVAAIALRPLGKLFDLGFQALDHIYSIALRWALAVPILVVAAAALLFANAWQRIPDLGSELLPEIHQGEFLAHVTLPVGSSLETTTDVMGELDLEVRQLFGIDSTALTLGVEKETLTSRIEGPNTARLSVRLVSAARTPELEEEVIANVRAVLLSHPAIETVEVQRPTPFALEAPVVIEVRGHDLEAISRAGREIEARLVQLEGLDDVSTNLRPGHPEALITFDRDKTSQYGLDLTVISSLVRDQLMGKVSTRFSQGDERVDVRIQGDEQALASLEDVLDLVINPNSDTPMPLRSVVELELVQGPAEIRRVDNSRAVIVTAQASGIDLGGMSSSIESALLELEMPKGVRWVMGGQKREMDQTQESMRFALFLAIFLVYVVMAAQFESLIQPFVILLTVPLALIGVIFALEWTGTPISVIVFIGVIMLAGIVVNNAIVLVDRINQKRAAGLEIKDAILEAGRARLRPILMTTATTALGLLPMTGLLADVPIIGALGSGEGAEMRAPMAIAVISGLISSTLLTLLVVPTVYRLLSGIGPSPKPDAVDSAS